MKVVNEYAGAFRDEVASFVPVVEREAEKLNMSIRITGFNEDDEVKFNGKMGFGNPSDFGESCHIQLNNSKPKFSKEDIPELIAHEIGHCAELRNLTKISHNELLTDFCSNHKELGGMGLCGVTSQVISKARSEVFAENFTKKITGRYGSPPVKTGNAEMDGMGVWKMLKFAVMKADEDPYMVDAYIDFLKDHIAYGILCNRSDAHRKCSEFRSMTSIKLTQLGLRGEEMADYSESFDYEKFKNFLENSLPVMRELNELVAEQFIRGEKVKMNKDFMLGYMDKKLGRGLIMTGQMVLEDEEMRRYLD